jgi:hypothetical protein
MFSLLFDEQIKSTFLFLLQELSVQQKLAQAAK